MFYVLAKEGIGLKEQVLLIAHNLHRMIVGLFVGKYCGVCDVYVPILFIVRLYFVVSFHSMGIYFI